MEEFSSLDRFLLFATVGGMFAALAFYAAERTKRFWKKPFARFARASRPAQALVLAFLVAATAIGGGKTNAPPMRAGGGLVRTIPAEDLPAWFVALGYSATDADESGIPDCWEKWTHTRGFASDADPDGDGLTNLEEFEAQTDPIRADTDGDGIDDATELAGLAAGVADLDPVTPATFAADEPDTDGDGVPDLWEDSGTWTFEGTDAAGFPVSFDFPVEDAGNYDVRVSVTSTRHALLSWGTGEGESVLLPPCTNLLLRLRLAADGEQTVALSPDPSGGGTTGLWKAELVADWDGRRNLPTEDDRVGLPDGTAVDRSVRASRFTGVLGQMTAMRSGAPGRRGGAGGRPAIQFTPRRLALVVLEGCCRVHGPDPLFRAVGLNAAPPYVWTDGGVETATETPLYRARYGGPDGTFDVSCRCQDGHSALLVEDSVRYDPVTCRPGRTNFVGAAWTSTHNPTNAADHAPGIEPVDRRFGPLCPVAHDVDVKLGWTHDTAILWIRNLVRIVTGLVQYDDTDHCIAIEWTKNGSVDLWTFVDSSCFSFTNQLTIRDATSGVVSRHAVSVFMHGSKPDRYNPTIRNFALCNLSGSEVYDRFWLVLFSPDEKNEFDKWYLENTADMSWTNALPKPPPQLNLSTNPATGEVTATVPALSIYEGWSAPTKIKPDKYIHHDACYEIRTEMWGEHGNQATYDADGILITETIAAGTADYEGPYNAWGMPGGARSHRNKDVLPFIQALQMDGNPAVATPSDYAPHNLTAPCLRQGTYLEKYIECRPIIK